MADSLFVIEFVFVAEVVFVTFNEKELVEVNDSLLLVV